jgi:hypothetical protein
MLVEHVEQWFRGKNVHSCELQVICNNAQGIAFWESLGYQHELLQMRKVCSAPTSSEGQQDS